MGSPGGSSWPTNIDPKQAEEYYKDSKSKTERIAFEQKVSKLLDNYLEQFNKRDVNKIQDRLNEIKDALKRDIEGFIDLRYGGSIQKHTYVDGLSDIDTLAIVNKSELLNADPDEVKKYFLKTIKKNVKGLTSVSDGKLAVTLRFKDGMEIQLLPAIKTQQGIKIPDASGESWSNIVNPNKFADKLSKLNAKVGYKVVPTIKLIKAINSQLPEKNQMTGYHIESLAIKTFSSCKAGETTKDLIGKFFQEAKDAIKTPISDKSGQSIHVDDYLGKRNSETRRRLSYQLDLIARKIKSANDSCSIKTWENIFGDV